MYAQGHYLQIPNSDLVRGSLISRFLPVIESMVLLATGSYLWLSPCFSYLQVPTCDGVHGSLGSRFLPVIESVFLLSSGSYLWLSPWFSWLQVPM